MNWLRIITIVIAAGVVTGAAAVSVPSQGRVQEAGDIALAGWMRSGPSAHLTGPWLALVGENRAFELREVLVRRTRQQPVCGDPGFALTAQGVKPGTLLLRGFSAVKAGPVVTAFNGGRWGKFLLPGEQLALAVGDEGWSLNAFGTVRPGGSGRGEARITDYQVHMIGRGLTAVVFSLARVGNDGPPSILWAGDLDGDRVVDVFAQLRGYPGRHHALFLSSLAGPDQLVAKAASLSTDGC